MAYVKLYLPDTPTTAITVLCSSVNCAGKKNTENSPSANIDGPIVIQTQSYENVSIVLSGVQLTQQSGTLDWADILELYKHKFDNTNPAYIEVQYGPTKLDFSGVFDLTGTAGTTKIPVILESFSLPLDTKASIDSHLPVVRLNFRETDTE